MPTKMNHVKLNPNVTLRQVVACGAVNENHVFKFEIKHAVVDYAET